MPSIPPAAALDQSTVDDQLIMTVEAADQAKVDVAEALLKVSGVRNRNAFIVRIADLAARRLRETRLHAYRSAVKPIKLESYNRDYLKSVVDSAKNQRDRDEERSSKALSNLGKVSSIAANVSSRAGLALSILDNWMVGNKRLRDATKSDIRAAKDKDEAASIGLMQNVEFYELIEAKLPREDATVGQCISLEEINQMREQVYVNH